MTDYTTITEEQTDPGAPLTSDLVKALRDNPLAVAEGSAGAPSVLPNIAVNVMFGDPGTYVFAKTLGTTDTGGGGTVAGASLYPTGAIQSVNLNGTTTLSVTTGAALTGTWMVMGYNDPDLGGGFTTNDAATLWVRVLP